MKIGILGAMEEEILFLAKYIKNQNSFVIGKRKYICGEIFGHEVCVVFSRWGKVAASSTATILLERFGVERLIFTGVAGGVDPQLNVGDIVVADDLVQHDMDASFLPGMVEFEIPLLGVSHFGVQDDDVEKAIRAVKNYFENELEREVSSENLAEFSIFSPKVVRGTIASGDQFISSTTKVAELSKKLPNLKCVEMEGAAVAQVAYEYNIPCIVLRTISDKANDEAVIDFPKFINSIASYFTCGSVLQLLKIL